MRSITITLVVAVFSFATACATASSPIDDALPATQDTAPSLPPPSIAPESPPSDTTDVEDSGMTPPPPPKKDASTPPPPPPPPQICINEAGPPLAVQTVCGCDKDCASALVCAKVGGLLEPWCCVPLAGACADDNDCCGNMLCSGGDGGTKTCK